MCSAPSFHFRRQCLALALLATSWSLPSSAQADVYALETVKTVADTLKPNVLVVLETAESMQDLPGENGARYNEVGADCEDGSRQCRLVGQAGRWNFSGMGSKGMAFGDPNASCTRTVTNTQTDTVNVTQTPTSTLTGTVTNSNTQTTTETNTNTNTNTNTVTDTVTNTQTNTTTTTNTTTQTLTNTTTLTDTNTVTNTATQTQTATSTLTVTNSSTVTSTTTVTNTSTSSVSATTYEAESMAYHSTGISGTVPVDNWTLFENGYMTDTRTFGAGSTTITVRAWGTPYSGTYAHFTVSVGGVSIGGAYTTASAANYNFTFTSTAGAQEVRIAFDNDGSGGSEDRNLWVDYYRISAQVITSTSTGTSTTTSVGTGTDICTTTSTIEAETLVVTGMTVGTATGTDAVSSGNVFVTFPTSSTPGLGDYLEFTVPVAVSGTYNVSYTYKSKNNRGINQARIDGVNAGNTTDEYDTAQTIHVSADLGSHVLSAGNHTIRLTIVDKNPSSSGYLMVVDTIVLAKTSCTSTATTTLTVVGTGTGTTTGTGTVSGTGTYTDTGSGTATQTATATSTETSTNTTTTTSTETATGTTSSVATSTNTSTLTDTSSYTDTATQTSTATGTQVYGCGSSGSTDTLDCNAGVPTTGGFCNETSGLSCFVDSACSSIKGDFCRAISTVDGSGRLLNETCVTSAGSPWGSCKHGVVTTNTPCASSGDTSCESALPGDYCTEGQPAKMCSDSGLWCASNADCPGTAGVDVCVPASSRMMITKRALRRAITDHADKVNFGFMSTYQGKGVGGSNVETEIFPYVKLQSCSGLKTITETKFLARGELEQAGCFNMSDGPSSSCTIDYGGNGAINNSHAAYNQVDYTLVGTDDSRWAIPRSDGTGKSNHLEESWLSCPSTELLPACKFSGQGTALYEGSYYTFTYTQGTPIANGGVDGEGSLAHPAYFTTYKGKYYSDGVNCYNAVDAERTDIVNDGIYGRPAYTGHPYDYTNEVPVPWGGSTTSSACDATTGAIWHQNVVPFLTDTSFGGQSITRAQKTLMTTARLNKASFGGVDATGKLAPLGCALKNDAAADRYHSAADYMATVQSTDATNNGGNTPCWSNNIILVVDGQSNGPDDMDGSVDCASTACAYNAGSNPTLTGCNCSAIMKAYGLAHSGTPVQTHVVVNAPTTWSTRFPYSYAFLWNLAVAGSPNFDGTPSFGSSEDEVYRAVSDKIAVAAYHFPYTTTTAVAGAATQDPNSLIVSASNYLYDTSVSYPTWKGTVRAFDVTSSVELKWDAVTVAASGHPADWTKRRIFFSKANGTIAQVQVSEDGDIGNKGDLYTAGLGASSDEAELIMQWLLGKPELKNPAPLMGSVTSSTPIVVGQGAANGLNGSTQYSADTWKRPHLVYVGGDDGMLHAFFGHAGTKTLNGTDYMGGEEAFAFIPNDMLPVISKQYAQGGQQLAVDRSEHIFGLAGSPKVKDMCMGSGCETSTGSDWHTVLVMPEGPGGNKPFALDITDVIDTASGLTPSNMSLLWSAALSSVPNASEWDQYLGETSSVPAFYFAGYSSGAADNRVVFASGYRTKSGSSYDSQGLVIVNADAVTGDIKQYKKVTDLSLTSCTQTHTVRADIGLARDYSSLSTSQNLMAAYTGDTWGNTFQYVPTAGTSALTKLYALGCGQPLHFAPAVVQLDRAPKADTSSKQQIYLVQVTNSNLDPDTLAVSTDYPASKLVVTKLDGNVSPPTIVTSYNPLEGTGQIILSLDPAASAATRICIQTVDSGTGSLNSFTDNAKQAGQSCAEAGAEPLPSTARPVGTPNIILRADGLGFQAITSWYDPAAMTNNCSSGSQFDYGTSYVTVHEFGADGTWYQIAGVTLDNTVLTGTTFIGTGLFVDGINASSTPAGINIGETFSTTQQILNNSARDRYLRTSWSERQDL